MILSCNSCEKKFVVPDNAIGISGRLVQCSACGNKWKQFPIKSNLEKDASNKKINIEKKQKSINTKKKRVRKEREINLYSPEYLAKKHGISLNKTVVKKTSIDQKISFGFYNLLIVFLVISISLIKGLHFFQEFIVQKLPFAEFYLNYFFESLKNIFEICKNLIANY
jgi:predicted Zn finger-like uncharacterized protein